MEKSKKTNNNFQILSSLWDENETLSRKLDRIDRLNRSPKNKPLNDNWLVKKKNFLPWRCGFKQSQASIAHSSLISVEDVSNAKSYTPLIQAYHTNNCHFSQKAQELSKNPNQHLKTLNNLLCPLLVETQPTSLQIHRKSVAPLLPPIFPTIITSPANKTTSCLPPSNSHKVTTCRKDSKEQEKKEETMKLMKQVVYSAWSNHGFMFLINLNYNLNKVKHNSLKVNNNDSCAYNQYKKSQQLIDTTKQKIQDEEENVLGNEVSLEDTNVEKSCEINFSLYHKQNVKKLKKSINTINSLNAFRNESKEKNDGAIGLSSLTDKNPHPENPSYLHNVTNRIEIKKSSNKYDYVQILSTDVKKHIELYREKITYDNIKKYTAFYNFDSSDSNNYNKKVFIYLLIF